MATFVYIATSLDGFIARKDTKPVFVLSSTLRAPLEGGAELMNTTPREAVAALHARGLRNLYVDGGVTIQAFLREDLIDEMTITRIPIVLGSGLPLFGECGEIPFTHVGTKVFDDMLVKSRYVRARG